MNQVNTHNALLLSLTSSEATVDGRGYDALDEEQVDGLKKASSVSISYVATHKLLTTGAHNSIEVLQ